jgi:hypothetical protein
MNGETMFQILSRMPEELREQMHLIILSNKCHIDNLIADEKFYLISEVEKLDYAQANEIAIHIKPEQIQRFQESAYNDIIHLLDEADTIYRDTLKWLIKETMIEELRKVGYNVPDGI